MPDRHRRTPEPLREWLEAMPYGLMRLSGPDRQAQGMGQQLSRHLTTTSPVRRCRGPGHTPVHGPGDSASREHVPLDARIDASDFAKVDFSFA